ncbi:unnamed protein product [Hermetia illucens]|uniref:Uncharacterized protein n=1 Tax=Hermetia illucens TaxID=343691 RepID=A0A7R8UVR4_HERIL|nr:unnamed protein product [Hermetia illucens]
MVDYRVYFAILTNVGAERIELHRFRIIYFKRRAWRPRFSFAWYVVRLCQVRAVNWRRRLFENIVDAVEKVCWQQLS